MRDEYDFSKARRNPYAERIRREGITIAERHEDGSAQNRYFPPGTYPSAAKSVHVYPVKKVWVVRTEGASRAFRRVSTEEQATAIGLNLARKTGAELVVHFSVTRPRHAKVKAA